MITSVVTISTIMVSTVSQLLRVQVFTGTLLCSPADSLVHKRNFLLFQDLFLLQIIIY